MKAFLLVLFLPFLFTQILLAQKDFERLHQSATVVDGHNDILYRVMHGGEMETYGTRGHSDLPRFRRGGVDVQLFSVWVASKLKGDAAWQYALDQMDSLHAIAARNNENMRIVLTQNDMDEALTSNVLASLLHLEGGRCIDGRRDRILALHARGLRSFGLTWNYSSDWASCSKDESARKVKGGLSHKGKSFVRLLDSLGILIDVSHLGERAFWDVLSTSSHPVFASHSSCAALRPHHRNLTDKQLRALAENNGIAMMNYFPGFLSSRVNDSHRKQLRDYAKRHMALKNKYPDRGEDYLKAVDNLIQKAERKKLVTLRTLADHIDHAVSIAGIDHVGIGSDFDGIGLTPVGLADVTDLPLLTRELLRRGYTEPQIKKVLGENFLRVFRQVSPYVE